MAMSSNEIVRCVSEEYFHFSTISISTTLFVTHKDSLQAIQVWY